MFWLYRCRAPGVRAQSIQVIQSAWASASRGHEVTLAVQASRPGVGADEVLRFYGLTPVPTLRLNVLHPHNALAGVQHRFVLTRWLAQGGGVVIARSKRYADRLLAWAPGRVRVVLEAHEVDSAQAEERGQDPRELRALEARVLSRAVGVVANCEGTAKLLRAQHPSAPEMAVLHNATHVSRRRTPVGPGEGLGYAGSLRPEKDTANLQHTPLPLDVIGPERAPDMGVRVEIPGIGDQLRRHHRQTPQTPPVDRDELSPEPVGPVQPVHHGLIFFVKAHCARIGSDFPVSRSSTMTVTPSASCSNDLNRVRYRVETH